MGEFSREEPLVDVAYLTDGSLEGLLCAVLTAYERHEQPSDIIKDSRYAPRLGQSSINIETNFDRADRVRKGIVRAAGRNTFCAVIRASTNDDYDMGLIVYRFIRLVMNDAKNSNRPSVLEDLSNPIVADLQRLVNRAVNESEKMRQFVRFSQLENGVWFARCNPNASVIPLVMGYFTARLNDQPFIIYDETHHLAGVYDGRSWQLVAGEAACNLQATSHDALMQQAWKRFYDVLSVDDRYNPELRRHFMPVRFWRNLPEMEPSVATKSNSL